MPPPAEGLSQAEASRRLAARGEVEPPPTSRSWSSILRANLFTVFNVTLLFFGIVTLIFGDPRDAVFLAILVLNAGIGIIQEARAKASLDRLAALVAPRATVVRDGRPVQVAVDDVVPGDLVLVDAGDQVVADGRLARAEALGVDESILTGEAEPVSRAPGRPPARRVVRRGGDRRVRRRGRRPGHLRGAPGRRGARVPPSALPAGAARSTAWC